MANEQVKENGIPQTIAEWNVRLDELWLAQAQAIESRNVKAMGQAVTAIRAAENAKAKIADEAESEGRKVAIAEVQEMLLNLDAAVLNIAGIKLVGTVTKTDTGWDDLSMAIELPTNVTDEFWAVFPEDAVKDLVSLKGIKFEVEAGVATCEPTGRAARSSGSGGGGTSGKGYRQNGGPTLTLAQVFEAHATAEQKAELPNLDGNKSYSLKKKVAKDANFQMNEA
jgi:hypothetical protein